MSKLLNINSRFRKNYFQTTCTNFKVDLPNTIKNVINLGLDSIEIPTTFYAFSSKLKTDEFTIEIFKIDGKTKTKTNISQHRIKIKNGNYNGGQLEKYLNENIFVKDNLKLKRVDSTNLDNIRCQYDIITQKIILYSTNSEVGFNIDWRVKDDLTRNIQLNMGWMLGFREQYYTFDDDYNADVFQEQGFVSESIYNPISSNYVFLSINDYNNNFSPNLLSPFQVSSFNDNNILTKLILKNNKIDYDIDFKGPGHRREYMGPVNISKFEIKLLDEFGRIIDLNMVDYSFTMSLEILYD